MHRVFGTLLLHASTHFLFAKSMSASLHCIQPSYLQFSDVSLVLSLPGRGEEEETWSRDAAVPPPIPPPCFPVVFPIHRRFPSLSLSLLSQHILSPLGWSCAVQALQMLRVRCCEFAWQLLIFCF